jgi:hypothetical protein
MGYAQLGTFPLATGVNDDDSFYTDDANTETEQRTTAKQFSTYVLNGLAPQRQSIPVTANGQSLFETTGYMPTLINVYVAGFRLSPWQYQALDGLTVTITDPNVLAQIEAGMSIDIDACASLGVAGVATPASVAALDPANQPPIGTLSGTELISTRQGAVLYQCTVTKLAQFAQAFSNSEGNWLPALQGDGTAGLFGYTVQAGWYKRTGNLVTFGGALQAVGMPVVPTGNAQISLGNLPWKPPTSPNGYSAISAICRTGMALTASMGGDLVPGGTAIELFYLNGSGKVPASLLTASTYITFGGSFSAD